MIPSSQAPQASSPAFYRIMVEGKIRGDWSDWLNGMQITFSPAHARQQATILTGRITDQAALRGILCRLWDLNLTLLSVCRLTYKDLAKEGNHE